MYLTNENLTFVKKNDSQVVSMKYLDLQGNLNQIDFLAKNILADSNNHGFEINKNTCLLPISSKGFCDPFRAVPTSSFLCTNIADRLNTRRYASDLIDDVMANMIANFEAELTFWIDAPKESYGSWKCDPSDCYSNLRSDILETLESININTTIHMPGAQAGECIIGFKGSDIIDLADNFILTKFIIGNVAANYGQKISFAKGNAYNFKLILICNNNDGKSFIDNFVANSALMMGYNDFLQISNLDANSASKRELFNSDCRLEITLTTASNFIPYIKFAFVILYFSDHDQILQRLEDREFSKFVESHKKRTLEQE